ncbi:HTTM domain-containing protein [Lihuaxuella thermophila]|uniref:Vitamin K-dependent gamma-carboxylase n=1 Tax=Lihuaxuella thermophila TaxID=1173111 RepID=A0A1H8HRQ9_9BACL|nr:HTTM domain-containing protein [Lihuaxuella thermophila]SEN58675.1 Vitamin K-dependent gamma-carboxylase [Lihuaxuella thermophila]
MAAIIQLCVMYLTAGLYKLTGSMWLDGTALYYATRTQDYFTPGLSEWLWKNETLLKGMTYATVVYQVLFPILLLYRYTKYLALLAAFAFHAGIAVFMGLIDFSWIMISCELLLLSDREFQMIFKKYKRFVAWLRMKLLQSAG